MKLITIALLLLASTPFQGFSQSNDTITWTILMGGNVSGFIKKWKNSDGSFSEWRQFKDRGRGDSTRSTYRYDNRGYMISFYGSGVDYFKKPVAEKFENVNGVVRWENGSEKEERKINYSAEYIRLNVDAGKLYDLYFQNPDKKVKHLPSGESTLTVLKELTLSNGKHIRLISIKGADYTPDYAWIDDDNQFFAYASDYHAPIRKGYESYNDQLFKIQNEFARANFQELSKQLSETPAGIVIKNASLFDSKSGTVKQSSTIVVENGIVREITSGKKVSVPKNFKEIDATGKFVMPGLWDNHVHSPEPHNLFLLIGSGVTHVRDMASGSAFLARKKEIEDGILIGPQVLMAGIIDAKGPYAGPSDKLITNVEEGKTLVKKYAEDGYSQIKLYSSLQPEWVKPLADEAKRLGLRVSGHIPAHMLAEDAIQDGFDEIQHINMLFLNFYGKELDTRTPARFVTVAQKAAYFDFENEQWKSFLDFLKQHKTVIDPTVSIYEDRFTGKPGAFNPSAASFANRLPVFRQRRLTSGSSLQIPEGLEETYKNSFLSMLKMLKVLYDHGITIIPGTDNYPAGLALHTELANYVRAGIPNNEVLKMATLTSAQVNRKSDQYGSIEPNRPADIIIIEGNPLQNILDTQKVETVIQGKAVYRTRDLLNAVSVKSYR